MKKNKCLYFVDIQQASTELSEGRLNASSRGLTPFSKVAERSEANLIEMERNPPGKQAGKQANTNMKKGRN